MEYSNSLAKQYAEEHRTFLRENAPKMFESLSQSGDLEKHLHSVGEDAAEMFEHLMAQKVNDKKEQEKPYLQRVEALQGHRLAVQEMVRHDLIHQPEPE
jgi:hypothetical protein